MDISPHNTEHLIHFWIPLPHPLGVPDDQEIYLKSRALFPQEEPGFYLSAEGEKSYYADQIWLFHQSTRTPTSSGLELAEAIYRKRLEEVFGVKTLALDIPAEMSKIGVQWETVVEATCPIEGPEHDAIVEKLNDVIASLGRFQVGLDQLHGEAAALLTPRAIDPVPFVVVRLDDTGEARFGLTSTGNVTKYATMVNLTMASQADLMMLAKNGMSRTAAFRPAKVLEMEARSAYASGANILAAICFGAAAEARLTELCLFLSWEAELDPVAAAKAVGGKGGVSDKCLQLLARHLKGNWNRHSSPALRSWGQHIVKLRNQATHGGYEPTSAEIDRAQEALQELASFLRERLLAGVDRFPYVNSYYLGHQALREMNLFDRWERATVSYALTPDPEGSFFRFKAEVRQSGANAADESTLRGEHVIRLTDSKARHSWIQLDEATFQARQVIAPQQAVGELQRIRLKTDQGDFTEVLVSVDEAAIHPCGPWKRGSELLPSLSVRRSEEYEILEHTVLPRPSQ